MAILKRGKTWFIDYYYPPGRGGTRIREKVGPSKEDARIVLAERLKDIRQGRNPELRRIAPKPFTEMVAEFLERHARKLKAYHSVKLNTDALVKYFGDRMLQEITPKLIEDFIKARLGDGASKATTNRQRACLSKIFNCAIDWDYYGGENPVRRVKPFKESAGRVRFLSAEEAAKLIEKATAYLRPIVICALHTGGRLGEILSLRWEDVDLDRGVLYFDQTNTKSGKQREIPIDGELRAALEEQRKRRFMGGDAREYVFTWRGNRIVGRGGVRTAFERARDLAGLGEDVTLHTCRHTFASWFMINGGDLYRLQKYLGHSTITLTQRYAHLSEDFQRAGVAYFGAPAGTRSHTVVTNEGSGENAGSVSA